MPNPQQKPIGILGGTFDPIHLGHLRIADTAINQLPLASILFLPCYQPVHKPPPKASPDDRAAMIGLALEGHPKFQLDRREIQRQGPSFMIDTLISLKKDYPYTPLCLLLGMDAYLTITTWKCWHKLLDYAHLIIMNRPAITQKHPDILFLEHQTSIKTELVTYFAGKVLFLEITPCPISATTIRYCLEEEQDVTAFLPKKVYDYIREHHLYKKGSHGNR